MKRFIPLLLIAVIGLVPASAQAGVVVPTTPLEAAEALSTQPSLVTGASWVLQPTIVGQAEVAPTVVIANTALLGFPTNGSQFLAFSSGFATHVEFADQTEYNYGAFENAPGTTAHDEGSGVVNDLTILHVAINVPAGKNCLALDFRFLSQEYPQYVGEYDDGFLVELDADNWKIRSGSASFNAPANFATDSEGQPLSVNSTGTLALSPAGAAGSGFEGTNEGEAFGGGTALLSAETPITAGAHNLYFSVFDAVDHELDSGAFVDHLRAFDASSCPRGAVPSGEAATPPAPVATATDPQVSGSPVVGDTLSATTGTFTGEELTYTYQWLLEGAPITGATGATYMLTNADTTHKLSVVVTATNSGGHANETSSQTATVTPAAPLATATLPQVSGSTVVGDTLSATTGAFTGEELTYTYQWLLEGAPITNATSATYQLTNADTGHKLSVVVTAYNGGGHTNETSILSTTVTAAAPVATATLPQISGSPSAGDTLKATTGTFTGEELTYTYQWLLEGAPITNATSATYLLTNADVDHKLSVVVTATNSGGHTNETSILTAAVTPAAPLATATLPQISGSTTVGDTLKATTGTFTGEEPAYTYQWLLEGVPITGATSATYLLTDADTDHELSVVVTATNGGGHASETSALTSNVIPVAPIATPEVPLISGSPVVGDTLSATTGTVTGEELAYSYQWLLEGVPITGATSASYVVTSADVGHKLSVRVTALNGGGEATESSALSATVTLAATLALATIPAPELAATTPPEASTTSAGGPMPCRSSRVETIHWHTAAGVRLTRITITLNGKPYDSLTGVSRHAAVSLVGRGPGEVLVRITGRTAAGEHYSLSRVFHPCVSGIEPAQLPSLFLGRSGDM